MPSPFPGMNPFLEQSDAWEDFHHNFISRAQESLAGEVGPNYFVKVETRIYIRELSPEERGFFGRADVSVSSNPSTRSPVTAIATPVAAAAAPLDLSFPNVDRERHTWLEIVDSRNRKVVTVLELLSPTNKRSGPDRDDYLSKRARLTIGFVNFVEIDLRRGGTRPQPPALPPCDYYVLVSRKQEWPRFALWSLSLRDRLPTIGVPLQPPDADVPLNLQAMLDRSYDAAGYGKYIYSETPEPPLSPETAEWAKTFIPQAASGTSQ